ncbi:MAG: hypothetical protein CO118_02855 [Flavobacteriales bacterium CG_4_9_14_3_um_filter_32_8]|nr:MAG: hypothetical protein CO118_02855 [Flavobacteriales bacterium CG_4_9_14_3_um_filter_32_8]
MYIDISKNKTPLLKFYFTFLFAFLFAITYGQKNKKKVNYETVYAIEFKQIKECPYNIKLISLSETVSGKKWKNHYEGSMSDLDTICQFNNNFLCSSFPTNSNHLTNEYLIFYFSLKKNSCPTLFSLLNYYQNIIDTNLQTNNLPKELKLIPAVCSAFNPYSFNGIGGVGFWHLNYPQAIKYGLLIDELVDERKDFKKSTQAATSYLKDLYLIYNNWELTLAAYSCGVTTVNKYINRSKEKTYEAIYPNLPKETRDFVQAFVAMNYIANYDNYGSVQINPIIAADTIKIERKLLYKSLKDVMQIDLTELTFLNPTLNVEIFPSNFTAYFPKGSKEKYMRLKDSIYFYQDSVVLKPKIDSIAIPKDGEPFTYKVKSGDVLGTIASQFHVRVSQLQDWNNLNGTRINIGQQLTIYKKSSTKKTEEIGEDNQSQEQEKPTINTIKKSNGNFITYTVKSGDNLWLIAKNFPGISAEDIMELNEIDENIKAGQVLKIKTK